MMYEKFGVSALSILLSIGLLGCAENKAPVAMINSGESEKTVCHESNVTLSSKGSHDPDGEIASYTWSDKDGKVLSHARTLSQNFPDVGEFQYTLTVTDTEGATDTDSFTVIVGAPAEWTTLKGRGTSDLINGMSTDNQGNAITVGYTKKAKDANDKFDVNVMKISKTGEVLWSRDYNSSAHEIGYDSAVDSEGNIYIVGMTKGNFGDTEASCGTDRYPDPFVAKLSSTGDMQWGRMICTDKAGLARGVGVDAAGNVYVSGSINGDLEDQASQGKNDVFVAKFDSNGTKKYLTQIGTDQNDYADSLVVDAEGNAYVAGHTKGAIAETGNAGKYDTFVSKVDTNGTVAWSSQFGSDASDKNPAIALDNKNARLYITGRTYGSLGGGNSGSYDIFLTAMELDGTVSWTKQYGTEEIDVGEDVVVADNGNIFIAGNTNVLSEDDGKKHSNITVLKVSPEGTLLSHITKGTGTKDYAYGIALGACSSVYVGGYTRGDLEGQTHSTNGLNDKFVMHIDTVNMPPLKD